LAFASSSNSAGSMVDTRNVIGELSGGRET
jgi:hypothetical protein